MNTLNQQLGSADDKKLEYMLWLFKDEASDLIGDVSILINETELGEIIKFSRPGHVGRASDTRSTGTQLRLKYESEYFNRIKILSEMIAINLGIEIDNSFYSRFSLTYSEHSQDVKTNIRGHIDVLTRLAAEI